MNLPTVLKRNGTADLLKGLAVIFIILVHLVELFANESIYNSTFGHVVLYLGATPVAPLLMFLLGYFVARSNKSTTQLLGRGLKLFLAGMLLNIGLNFNLIISVLNGRFIINIWPYIFGVDIFLFAGMAIVLLALAKVFLKNKELLLLLIAFCLPLIGEYLSKVRPDSIFVNYITAFFVGNAEWSYFPLLPWLAYPLTGFVFFCLKEKNDFFIMRTVGIRVFIVIVYAVFIFFTMNYVLPFCTTLPLYYHHGILFFCWAFLFIGFYLALAQELENYAGNTLIMNYIKWLGKNITIIYILQWLIIGNIATEVYRTVSQPILIVACFLAVTFISSGIAAIVQRPGRNVTSS